MRSRPVMITDFISRSNIAANFGSWRRCGLLLRALVVFLGFAACFASPGAAQSNWQNQSKAETGGQNMAHVGDVLAGKRLLLQQDDIMLLQVNQPEPSNPTVTTTIVPFHTENSNYQPPQFPQLIQLGHNLSQTAFAPGSIFSSSGSGRMFNTNNDVVVVLKNSLQLSDLTPAWFVDLWDPAAGSNGWTQELEVKSALEPNG
ncbi:MAG: hypothetical protein JO061_10860, partial [Acidobacteriaceae bacterium]|nr:hypothetical protein [Acidobacteriaceae bacterium]